MNYLTPQEIATRLNLAINYQPAITKTTLSFDDYVLGIVASKMDLPRFIVAEMTDLEFDYFMSSSTENFIRLQKETVVKAKSTIN